MLGERTVQVGTMCLVSPALLHRDPRWWARPEQFRPDRWLRRVPGCRPLRPQVARPATRRLSSLRCRTPDVYRGAVCLVGATTVLAELGRTWRLHIHDAPLVVGRSSMTLRPNVVRATSLKIVICPKDLLD